MTGSSIKDKINKLEDLVFNSILTIQGHFKAIEKQIASVNESLREFEKLVEDKYYDQLAIVIKTEQSEEVQDLREDENGSQTD